MCYYSGHTLAQHQARVGEPLTVRPIYTGGTGMYGDNNELACVPHRAKLETQMVRPSSDRDVNGVLPGLTVTFLQKWSRDLIVLPNGKRKPLAAFHGFTYQLAQIKTGSPSREEIITPAELPEAVLLG